jgi:hypothetical protein
VGPAPGIGSKLQPSYLEFFFKKKNSKCHHFDPYSSLKLKVYDISSLPCNQSTQRYEERNYPQQLEVTMTSSLNMK